MKVGYIRVSTVEQNEERQKVALAPYGIEKFFEEKVSAKDTNRKGLQAMLDYVREGDIVYVEDFSRLARSTQDLLNIVESLNKKDVSIVSLKEKVDSSTASGKLMLTMIGAINEFERANLLERQREGIAIAKQAGKYKGRSVVQIEDETFEHEWNSYMAREISKSEMARRLGISRPTLARILKEKGLVG